MATSIKQMKHRDLGMWPGELADGVVVEDGDGKVGGLVEHMPLKVK